MIGALIQLAFLAYALRELTGMPLYGRMILWGSVLLALGFALDRGLRRPRGGITSAPLGARSRLEDLVQVYGAAHVTPAPSRRRHRVSKDKAAGSAVEARAAASDAALGHQPKTFLSPRMSAPPRSVPNRGSTPTATPAVPTP